MRRTQEKRKVVSPINIVGCCERRLALFAEEVKRRFWQIMPKNENNPSTKWRYDPTQDYSSRYETTNRDLKTLDPLQGNTDHSRLIDIQWELVDIKMLFTQS
jgi:hypothetical protein